jgi:glycosyltransferase involved in cell wall biosynthesis
MTNITTALAADFVWFNSGFHRGEFLGAIDGFFKRMNDNQPVGTAEKIMKKSAICPPGIAAFPRRDGRKTGPMRILWAGRWEHDKNPDDFFAALKILKESGCDFRLDCIGQQFRDGPECFALAKDYFADNIDCWGYQEKRCDYDKILCNADVFVSTANHEFFGISAAEAIAAGAYPLLPRRLAYPEILRGIETITNCDFFYDGSTKQLAEKLKALSQRINDDDLWQGQPGSGQLTMQMFGWAMRARIMDNDIEDIARYTDTS